MENNSGKRVLRSLRLGALLAALVLVTAGHSWGRAVAHADMSGNVYGLSSTDGDLEITVSNSVLYLMTTPDISCAEGGTHADVTYNPADLYFSLIAEAGAFSGMFVARAAGTSIYDFAVTAGAGNVIVDVYLSGYSQHISLTDGPTAYPATLTASTSLWVEIRNFSNPEPSRLQLLGDGRYTVSQQFTAGDVGSIRFDGVADATVKAVPEPTTLWLVGTGLFVGLGFRRYQSRQLRCVNGERIR